MDVKKAAIFCLFRIFLPFMLLVAVVFRFNIFSFIYLACLLINPLLAGPSPRYLKSVIGLSITFCICHIIFQAVMLSLGDYGDLIDYCDWKGRLFALLGFHRFDKVKVVDAIRILGLDFLVMLSASGVLVAIEKLTIVAQTVPAENQEFPDGDIIRRPVRRRKRKKSEVLYWTGETFVLFFLAGAGILYPSLSSAVYFLIFLTVCTWLSCNQKIGRKYLLTKVPLLIYCAIHFVCIYVYQVDYVQEYIPPDGLAARLMGLPDFVIQNCTNDPRTLVFQDHSWTVYASPFFILALYCLLALIIRKQLISPPVEEAKYEPGISRMDSKQSSQYSQGSVRRRKQSRRATRHQEEKSRLLDEDHTGRSYRTIEGGDPAAAANFAVDPNGSIIWTSESDMPEITAEVLEDEKNIASKSFTSNLKKVFTPIFSALKLVSKGSYIVTLIVMMTWSITYHSWLTFILLLWSCIVWMCPNSRYACLRSSPLLVFYAEALLLLQYIFGLNLNDDELPNFLITNKNIAQIGLVKYGDLAYQPLFIKILYTLMFWFTMRQFFEERQQSNQRNIAEGLTLEPFNISYNTANPACHRPSIIKRHFSIVPSTTSPNPYIRLVAETVSNLLTKYWIWVVASMLMVISLGGQVVVVYRIVYMFLFLFFILMFQFSYYWWRRIMYGFWLTVIVFSMLVLILIYTYQFQDFDYYWERYLHVPKPMQTDLGLERYNSDTGTLFVKLLTPTFFLIITIIQLHYFHKEFLLISDMQYRSNENLADTTQLTCATNLPNDSTETHITIEPEPEVNRPKSLDLKSTPVRRDTVVTTPGSEIATPTSPRNDELESNRAEREFRAVKLCLNDFFHEIQQGFTYISESLWRLLEIHIVKIVLLSAFTLAAFDVCAIHFVFVIFVVIALPLPALQSFFSHCTSVWAATLLLSKMMYQLNIVDYLNWQINCTNVVFANMSHVPYPFNTTIDNHDWIGFKRTQYLADYCKGYIGLILVLTIQAVVKIRQEVNRLHTNEPQPKPGVIFAHSTRATADDNLLECLKYLVNYFFYKFGLETCFVTIVACIGVRLDVFAFLSAVWLTSMFLLKRKTLARVWPFYVSYQCIVLTIQYIICLGLPPGLCIEYPWTESLVEGLREWLFLPDFQNPPSTTKIVADFFQLLFSCCQLFVFRVETSPVAELYEGGSNKEIDFDVAEPNPIPDFVTFTQTVLDMLKVFVFYAFYWISLAIVFVAGTSRINLFAMGYVVSCFYFLWNGNEFYLKSRPALLRMWNSLLAYNVGVILLSCLLQLIGCTYFELLRDHQCWIIQLLGIACQRKGNNPPKTTEQCKFESDPGLVYDIICFAFLLFQRRLFSSYYFQHVVNEVKAQQVLSSRGAELIHEIQMKEVQEQQVNEKEIMERIKKKMDRIRAYQQKIRGGENMEPETHFQAIRSGDYYMFEDISDEDIDLELSARHKRSFDDDDEDSAEVKEKGLNALLSKTIRGNIKLVEEPRKESGEPDDIEDSSQLSAIVSADRDALPSSSQKSPDPLTITSSGPMMTLSLPSSASSTSASSPKEDTVAPLSPQDVKIIEDEEEKEETFVEKIKRWYLFFCEFMSSVLISTTAKLNAVSKDYRFVARQLSKEKKLLKERFIHNGSFDMDKAENEMKSKEVENIPGSSKDLKQVAVVMKKTNLDFLDSCEFTSSQDVLETGVKKQHSVFVRFLVAFYFAAISRSELICYMVIIINQMKSASILSLPLPLFAFLWGTLSVPRPTKAFWITVITYTEAIVVLKYLFQFYFFPWNYSDPPPNNPFYPTVILGIIKYDNYAVYDLAVLLVVFFHRFMLKSLGLWKDTEKSLIIPNIDSEPETIDLNGKETDIVKKLPSIPDIKKTDSVHEEKLLEHTEDALVESPVECSEDEGSEVSAYEELPRVDINKILGSVVDPVKMFFYHLLYPEYRVTVDVYAYMFFCDFINFFIVVFGYGAFGTEGPEAVTSYFEENKVPIPFLIMLIAQFATIVTDRALYLRKYILGKLIFQVISVFVVHLWMFFILPAITSRDFVAPNNSPPKMWYIIKCIYLLLSAHQIRSGYPTRILGNYFCKKYNYANLILFKGYMIIPFLYELRSLMDWIWTDTSMNISNWLKMEDVYASIFVLKCTRRAEADYPTPRGAKRTALIKYGVGCSLLFFIILIIWFPLLLFALGNTVGRTNLPISCTVELSITGFEPIFRTTALKGEQIKAFNDQQWKELETAVAELADPQTTSLLTSYSKEDTVVIELSNNSTAIWTISPPSQNALIGELHRVNSTVKMVLSWSFMRKKETHETDPEVRHQKELVLSELQKKNLAEALSVNAGNATTIRGSVPMPVTVTEIFPNFVKIPSSGTASVVTQFYNKKTEKSQRFFGTSEFRGLNISMWTGDMLNISDALNSSVSHYIEWWEIQDVCQDRIPPYTISGINNCDSLRLIAFSDKAFPSELSIISGYGIVGLYTTFVLVVSRVVRGFVAGTSSNIMFDDMPYVDRVLQLCLDIYLVRESGEFTLEEDLFAKLIFLYRSPEMLIKWTRPPEQEVEGGNDVPRLPGIRP